MRRNKEVNGVKRSRVWTGKTHCMPTTQRTVRDSAPHCVLVLYKCVICPSALTSALHTSVPLEHAY